MIIAFILVGIVVLIYLRTRNMLPDSPFVGTWVQADNRIVITQNFVVTINQYAAQYTFNSDTLTGLDATKKLVTLTIVDGKLQCSTLGEFSAG